MAGRYSRSSLMGILVTSAVAGAGLSLGRDVYRKTRDNLLFIIVAAIALAGTAYGVWNMTRGHDRGPVARFFLTYVANILIILLSVSVFGGICAILFASGNRNNAQTGIPAGLIVFVLVAQGLLGLVGLILGLRQRGPRLIAFQVDKDNERFLRDNGFTEVGGNNDVILDERGDELVLEDFRTDAVVFKVKGRRSVRAKIYLDAHGRFMLYEPVP